MTGPGEPVRAIYAGAGRRQTPMFRAMARRRLTPRARVA